MGAVRKGDFVFVAWLDAVSQDDWTEIKNFDNPPPEIHSVGIFVQKEKGYIVIALNHDTINDSVSCVMTIPTGMIKSIRKLK